jgi:hypothetical protein
VDRRDDLVPENPPHSPTNYREVAATIRRLADRVQFDFGRRNQLLSLADGFERLAARLEQRELDHT